MFKDNLINMRKFGVVKVGAKGQSVIPIKARKIFDINPGII